MSIGIKGPLNLWPITNIVGFFKVKSKIASEGKLKPTLPKSAPTVNGPLDFFDKMLG